MNFSTSKKQLLFVFVWICSFSLWAQDTGIYVNSATSGGGGDSIQIDISVTGFVNLASYEFTLLWDTSILDYVGVGNFNLPGLDENSFGVASISDGELIAIWVDPDVSGEDLPDSTVIFSLFLSAPCGTTGTSVISFDLGANLEVATPDVAYTPTATPGPLNFTAGVEASNSSVSQVISCNGANDGCIQVSPAEGNPPYSYLWSNDSTTAEICNLVPGAYVCTVTDAGNCTTVSDTIQITEPSILEICQDTVTNPTCLNGNDGCIILHACGGTPSYTYNWSNGETTNEVCGLAPGTYTCTVTDNNGCVDSIMIDLINPSDPLVLESSDVVDATCTTLGSIDLTPGGGQTPYDYIWSNDEETQDIEELPAGTYTCTITDDNGCSTVTPTFVIEQVGNDMTATNTTIDVDCFGDSDGAIDLTVNGTATPFEYIWSNGDTTQNINGLTSGLYSCTITDASECTLVISDILVDQPSAALTINTVTTVDVLCNGEETGSINLDITGGTAPYNYDWNTGATTSSITDIAAGNYSCTITDENGCMTTTGTIQITEPEILEVCQNTVTNPSCFGGNDACILVMACGGNPSYTYSWSNGETTNEICGLGTGTYTCTITDNNGCTTSTMLVVTEPSDPIALESTNEVDATCTTGGSIDLTIEGGETPYTYDWSNGMSSQDLDDLDIGTYACTISDDNGCSIVTPIFSIELIGNDMSATNTSTAVDCFGGDNGSIDLMVDGSATPFEYDWNNGDDTPNIDGLTSGLYSCTVTDASGCTLVVSNILVDEPEAPVVINSLNQIDILCNGEETGSISLDIGGGTAPYTYDWNTGESTSGISNLGSGDYSCTITDDNDCTITTGTVTISETSSAISISNLGITNVTCFNGQDGSISFTANGGTPPYSYLWNNDLTTSSITGLSEGDYQCTITDDNDCTFTTPLLNVSMPSLITVENEIITDATCGGGGSITLTVDGGDGSYSFQWSNGTSGNPLEDVAAGNYTCTITDNSNCSIVSSSYTIVLAGSDLALDNTTITPVSCFDGNNGAINLTISGTATPYQFNWNNGGNSSEITDLSSDVYACTITDANGCSIIVDEVEVTQPEAPLEVSGINQSDILCQGGEDGSINIEMSGGTEPYSYLWNTGAVSQEITDLAIGDYTCTITDNNNCTISTITITVTEPTSSVGFTNLSITDLTCNGSNDGQVSLVGTGGAGGYTYLWNNGDMTPSITNLEAGPYQCTITDINGCAFVTNSFDVGTLDPITLTNFVITNATCDEGGSISLTNGGGTSPYAYIWSNGDTGSPLTDANAGNYNCTVTDNSGCTLVTQFFTILLEDSDLNLNAYNSVDVSCFGDMDGSINLAISGTATPFMFNWSNGANTQNISDLAPNNYTCTITDANGCSVISPAIAISQPSAPLTIDDINKNDLSCADADDGSITLTMSGGTSPYSYTWNFGGNSSTISNLTPGTYVCTITDDNGCTISTTAISIDGPPAIVLTNSTLVDALCGQAGSGSIDISVSGGVSPYTYLWNTGDITQDLNNISAGSYTCTITDNSNCTLATQEFVILNTGSDLSLGVDNINPVSCFDGSDGAIDLSVTGTATPFSFIWSNGEMTQNISDLPAGTYVCTVTDANNCTSISSSIQITQPDLALAISNNVTTDVTCFGYSNGSIALEISGGTEPYNYLWNNGAVTSSVDNLSPGDYSCDITDAMGCTISTALINITEPTALEITDILTENVICGQGDQGSIDITVAGGVTPYTYDWSNGAFTQDLENLAAGNYSCTITDNNDCVLETIMITIDDEGSDLQIVSEVPTAVSCFGGNNGSIVLEATGSALPLNYEWNTGANSPNIDNLTAGIYSCTITDANGCFISSTNINVDQPEEPINISGVQISNSSCTGGGDTGTIMLTIQGGTMPYSYDWNNGGTTSEINDLPVGDYTCTVTDANDCVFIVGPLVVTMPDPLVLETVDTGSAGCSSGGFIEITIDGGTSPYTYLWNNGSNAQNLFNIPAGNYICTVTDSEGCTFTTDQITVFNDGTDLSWMATNRQLILCHGDNNGSIDIEVNGTAMPFQYIWSNGAMTEDIDNLSPGLYSCTITDASGCSIVLPDIAITEPESPLSEIDGSQSNPLCSDSNDGSILLNIIGGVDPYNYLWNNGDETNSPGGLGAGDYTCTVTDANGCELISSTIILDAPPAIELTNEQVVHEMDGDGSGSIAINLSGGTEPFTFLWSNEETTQDIAGLSAGEYTCIITDANGCSTEVGPFIVENLVSTLDLENSTFRIFPNPTADVINIDSEYAIAEARILDVSGKYYVLTKINESFEQVQLTKFPDGIYILEVSFQNGQKAYQRVVKIQ